MLCSMISIALTDPIKMQREVRNRSACDLINEVCRRMRKSLCRFSSVALASVGEGMPHSSLVFGAPEDGSLDPPLRPANFNK